MVADDPAGLAVPGPEVDDAVPLQPKTSPANVPEQLKRRWLVVLLRNKGEVLGRVEATDVASARGLRPSSLIWTKFSATGSWCGLG